jgi:ribosomal protein S6--L-glutamate ligase
VAEFLLILRSNTFGQPTNDNLKNYIKLRESKYRFAYWSFSQQSSCTATNGLWKQGEMRGHEMHFLNIKSATCVLMLKHRKSTIDGIILNQFDAIIPRIRPSITFTAVP